MNSMPPCQRVRGVVDALAQEQRGADERERHGDGEHRRDRQREVAAEVRCRLSRDVVELEGHGQAATRRRRGPGRGRSCRGRARSRGGASCRRCDWSWVAITTVVPVRLMRSSSRMMPTDVAGSRLPVGSSASRISGRLTNARAIDTRCCSPPDSSFGKLSTFLARPTSSRIAGTCVWMTCFGPADHLERERDVLVDGLVRAAA